MKTYEEIKQLFEQARMVFFLMISMIGNWLIDMVGQLLMRQRSIIIFLKISINGV